MGLETSVNMKLLPVFLAFHFVGVHTPWIKGVPIIAYPLELLFLMLGFRN